jgi:acyl-CoA thioesterase-1
MMMLTNLGKNYVDAFNELYPRLARRHEVVFMPFFLQDVAAEPGKNQADGIHPNAAGYEILAANLLPYVEQAITLASP